MDKAVKSLGNTAKNIAIGLGIIILTSFVAIYGMHTFIDEPIYEDFCGGLRDTPTTPNQSSCEDIGGKWKTDIKPIEEPQSKSNESGWCDIDYYCRQEYEDAREEFAKIIFLVSVPLGILIIALGTFVFSLSSVGVGIMLGGVYTLIYGAAGYWRYGENWMRFTISLVALVVLILIAYRFNKAGKSKKKKRKFWFFGKLRE